MKVALITCPFQDVSTPSLQMGRLAGVLARQPSVEWCVRDFNVEIWNRCRNTAEGEFWSDSMKMFWLNPWLVKQWWGERVSLLDEMVSDIVTAGVDAVVMSLSAGSLYSGLLLASALKRAAPRMLLMAVNHHLLLGSQEATEHWRTTFFLDNVVFDVVLIGPSPDMFSFFLKDWPAHRILRPRPGFHCREDGRVMYGAPAVAIRQPDRLPAADFSKFPNELYSRPFCFTLDPALACQCKVCVAAGLGLTAGDVWSGPRLFIEAGLHRRQFPRKASFILRHSSPLMSAALDDFCGLIIDDQKTGGIDPWRWEIKTSSPLSPELATKAAQAGCERVVFERFFREDADSSAISMSLATREQTVFDPTRAMDQRIFGTEITQVDDDKLDVFYLPLLVLALPEVRELKWDGKKEKREFPAQEHSCEINGTRPQIFDAARLLSHQDRPASALLGCLKLKDQPGISVAVDQILRGYKDDMLRLWSVLKRLYRAENILDAQLDASREDIWLDSPSLRSPQARAMDFQRQRRAMQIFPKNLWQRGYRYLLTAGNRAVRMKIRRAKLDLSRELNQFVILWGNDRLSVDQALRLCNSYFRLDSEWCGIWKNWRDKVLRERACQVVDRAWVVERNVGRLNSLRRYISAADMIFKSLPTDERQKVWTGFCLFGRRAPVLRVEVPVHSWRYARKNRGMPRAAILLLAAARRASQIRGFRVLMDCGPNGTLILQCGEEKFSAESFKQLTPSDLRELVRGCLENRRRLLVGVSAETSVLLSGSR